MDVNAQLVHPPDPRRRVGQIDAGRGKGIAMGAVNYRVDPVMQIFDPPEAVDHLGTAFAFVGIEVIPGVLAFNHVAVGVDKAHR